MDDARFEAAMTNLEMSLDRTTRALETLIAQNHATTQRLAEFLAEIEGSDAITKERKS